ncbi:MAG: translation initiation factor IF-2 [Ruminococcaceae bacterium]|nr:translation initiation factor IF-2 [Oscillospiraceae bacterium]
MLSNQKYRISNIAKDFDVKSKELIELLDSYGMTGRTHMAVLTPDEFGVIFNHLTNKVQFEGIGKYIDGEIKIHEPERETVEEKKPSAPELSEKVEKKEEKPVEKKEENRAEKSVPQKQEPAKKQDGDALHKPSAPQTPSPKREENKPASKPAFNAENKPANAQNDVPKNNNNAQSNQPKDNFNKKKDQKKQPAQQRQHRQELKVERVLPDAPDAVRQSNHVAGTRVVDTRGTHVDLSKYDERLENFVHDPKMNYANDRKKVKKQNNNNKYDKNKDKEKLALEKIKKEELERAKKLQLQITVPDEITVGDLAVRMKVTAAETIKRLMKLGIMASVNQVIDYDTAFLVADELGIKVSKEVVVTIEEKLFDEKEDSEESLVKRAPVVCVMGHVDHGKTSLLDAIRHANVTAGEAGGITQHIGAYRVNVQGQDITFLDTPGHEAFTAMRARGAMATDIAILVVAADDGIMPQTVEAINHAKAAGIEIIVAINKMDKPAANPDNIKQSLTQYELVPEEWGGDVICVPVSAITKMGIDDLLENVLLVAEVKDLKANPNRRAKGVIIESKLDKGRGPVATVLVQAGTLHVGDVVIAGTSVGHVRAMLDDKGKNIKVAGPSVPVEIVGLSEVPESGDEFNAVEDERMARTLADQRRAKQKEAAFKANAKVSLDDLFAQISEGTKDLNIIVKADVNGSAEAVKQSLEKLSNNEVRVNVIHTAAGGITEGDVMLAAASNALIIGFHVRPDKKAIDSAERQEVEIRTYRIIYECIEEIEAAMKGMLAPEFKEEVLGHAEVRQTIHVPKVGTIAGSYVQDGKITRNSQIRVVRDGIIIFEDKISSLKRFKDDAKEVMQGFECGVGLEKFNDIKEGDILEAFEMVEVKK